MVHVIQGKRGFGDIIGEGLNQGLQAGFQKHFERKENKRQGTQLASYLGLNPEQSETFSSLHPEIQQMLAKDLIERKTIGEYARSQGFEFPESQGSPVNEGFQSLQNLAPQDHMGQIPQQQIPEQPREIPIDESSAFKFASKKLPFPITKKEQFKDAAAMEQKDYLAAKNDSSKLRQSISEKGDAAKRQLKAVQVQEDILNKGIGGPTSWDGIMSKLGLGHLASPEAQLFQSAGVDNIEGMREKFGVRLTDSDLKYVMNKLPDIARTPQGNKLILNLFRLFAEDSLVEDQIKNQIVKAADQRKYALYPEDLKERIATRKKEVYGPREQEINNNIQQLLSFSDKKGITKGITKGSEEKTLTKDIMKNFLNKAPGDTPEKKIENAKKLAAEEGYK